LEAFSIEAAMFGCFGVEGDDGFRMRDGRRAASGGVKLVTLVVMALEIRDSSSQVAPSRRSLVAKIKRQERTTIAWKMGKREIRIPNDALDEGFEKTRIRERSRFLSFNIHQTGRTRLDATGQSGPGSAQPSTTQQEKSTGGGEFQWRRDLLLNCLFASPRSDQFSPKGDWRVLRWRRSVRELYR
jgi:hypothetical protein